jgi:Cdc6-like AAA superfamily ATPase
MSNNREHINFILNRNKTAETIKELLLNFDEKSNDLTFKKGIYIYGSPGCGKTQFVSDLLKSIEFDMIKYDAGDVRNKSLIDTITCDNISSQNVLQMMAGKKKRRLVIVMDEIDGMNNGDKGGLNALIKLIRQKKTKKQKLESKTMNPIICIGNYYIDKKMRELMKVCNVFELKTPTQTQIERILSLDVNAFESIERNKKHLLHNYIQGDLRKLEFVKKILVNKPEIIHNGNFEKFFKTKSYNEDSKKITQLLINEPIKMEEHNNIMNETERTIVSLLWHENIVDTISEKPKERSLPFYMKVLDNICYADYIDRITFQSQIWIFNEMSSLMKTFYNNKLYHDEFPENNGKFKPDEVRFTKVLTKYSTEYNNMVFIYGLCSNLDLDKKDLISMFQELKIYNHITEKTNITDDLNKIEKIFQDMNITKLDIKRIYRYLEKNVKKDELIEEELE